VKCWQAKEITLREGNVGSMGRILCLEHCITTKKTFVPNVPRFPKEQIRTVKTVKKRRQSLHSWCIL